MKFSLDQFSNCTIVVIGDLILDVYFMGEVRRLSPEAPVPIVLVKEKTATLGGAGNVALNIRGLGCRAVMVGVRGDDPSGARLEEILRVHGIEGHLITDASRSTTTKTRVIGQGQQLLRLDEEETREVSESVRQSLLAKVEESLSGASAVVLSDYDKGVLNGALPQEIIRIARSHGLPVFVDPKRKGWERYSGATCVTPNTSELEEVTESPIDHDETLLARSANFLRKKYGIEWCLVTRGSKGMCLVGRDEVPHFISATAREVFDVSGAGDTVIATLACAVSAGFPMSKAAELSNRAAGIVVGKLGSQAIKRAELEADLQTSSHDLRLGGGSKVTDPGAAQIQLKTWRSFGEKTVYLHGCFDDLHHGHIRVLKRAKELGDHLVVGIAGSMKSSGSEKTIDPRLLAQNRAIVLSAIDCVDLVVVTEDKNFVADVDLLRPDIIVLTGRAKDVEQAVQAYGGSVHYMQFV